MCGTDSDGTISPNDFQVTAISGLEKILPLIPSPEEQDEYFSYPNDWGVLYVRVREGHEREDFQSFVKRFIRLAAIKKE